MPSHIPHVHPEILLKASRLVQRYRALQDTVVRQSEKIKAQELQQAALQATVARQDERIKAQRLQQAAMERKIDELQTQLEHSKRELAEKKAGLAVASGGTSAARATSCKDAMTLGGQSPPSPGDWSANHRSTHEERDAMSVASSLHGTFLQQFDYHIDPCLRPFWHKGFLTTADIESMRVARHDNDATRSVNSQAEIEDGKGTNHALSHATGDSTVVNSEPDSIAVEELNRAISQCTTRSDDSLTFSATYKDKQTDLFEANTRLDCRSERQPNLHTSKHQSTQQRSLTAVRKSRRVQGRSPSLSVAIDGSQIGRKRSSFQPSPRDSRMPLKSIVNTGGSQAAKCRSRFSSKRLA
ncbi:hypothetical protein ANO11243_007430 [Dothideomycetidae sp. 11243]|nr:hypothetical protein ANO11243_007430 [fungal sp. No.11243]